MTPFIIVGILLAGLLLESAIRNSAPRIIIVQSSDDGETFTCQTESGHVVVTDEGGAEQLKDCE